MADTKTTQIEKNIEQTPEEKEETRKEEESKEIVEFVSKTVYDDVMPIELSETKEQEIIKHLIKEINDAQHPTLDTEIQEYNDMYAMQVPAKDFPWTNSSNVASTIPARSVDGILSRIMRVLFETGPVCVVEGVGVKDAYKVEAFIDKVIRVKMKARPTFRKLIRKLLKVKCAVSKLTWVTEVRRGRDIEEYDDLTKFKDEYASAKEANCSDDTYRKYIIALKAGKKIRVPISKDKKLYRGVKLDIVDRKDFYVPDYTIDTQTCEWNGQKIENVRWDDIEWKVKRNIFRKKAVDKLREMVNKGNGAKLDSPSSYRKQKYSYYECIWRYDVDDEGFERECIFVIDVKHKILLKADYYHYFHDRRFFIPSVVIDSDSWDGIGIIERLYPIVKQDQDLRNITIDSETMAMLRVIKAKLDRGINISEYEWYPGAVWWVRDMDDIQEFGTHSAGRGLKDEISKLETEAEQLVRLSSYHGGREAPGDKDAPAKKAIALIQEGNIGIDDYKDCLQDSVSEIFYQICELYYQFATDEELKELGITNRALLHQAGMTMKLRGSTISANKDIQRQDANVIFNMLRKDPEIAKRPRAMRKIFENLFLAMDREDILNEFPDEEELKKEQIEIQKKAYLQAMKEREEQQAQQRQMLLQQQLGQMRGQMGGALQRMGGVQPQEPPRQLQTAGVQLPQRPM